MLWHPCCGGPTFVKPKARSKAEKAAAKAYEASRTAEEKEGFGKALHETMDLWYAHQGTTVYMLTQLPEGCTRKVGYDDSGWTTYERCSAEQIKKVYLPDAKWKLVLDLGAADASGQAAARRWPVGPEDFDKLIENKQFTNGADKEAVAALRRKMSTKQLGGIKELQFFAMATAPSVKDALSLGQCLNLCTSLQLLGIGEVRLSDEACAGLFSILAGGAMPKLEKLCLDGNKIGNEGTKSLSTALTSGAMVQLKSIRLCSNQIGDEGMKAFSTALASGAMAQLETLYLGQNQIGDESMKAFTTALASGATTKLFSLFLYDIPASPAAQQAARDAINDVVFPRLLKEHYFE